MKSVANASFPMAGRPTVEPDVFAKKQLAIRADSRHVYKPLKFKFIEVYLRPKNRIRVSKNMDLTS